MLAHAFLVVTAVTEHAHHPPPSGLIGLTCNEIQHLFAALVAVPLADPDTAALVAVATTTASPRPELPLPTTGQPTMKITIMAAALG